MKLILYVYTNEDLNHSIGLFYVYEFLFIKTRKKEKNIHLEK